MELDRMETIYDNEIKIYTTLRQFQKKFYERILRSAPNEWMDKQTDEG